MPLTDLALPLLRGSGVTLLITLAGIGLAGLIAFGAGLARLSPWWPLRASVIVYVETIRGTSLLVQLFILFYVLPFSGIYLGPLETGILALGLNFGAYGSEVVRAAIIDVDRGQWDAAIALNMSRPLAIRRVILPQALLAMLPSFANMAVQLLKATSLTSLISISELTQAATQLVQSGTGTSLVYSAVLIIYFALAFPFTLALRRIERRVGRGLQLGPV